MSGGLLVGVSVGVGVSACSAGYVLKKSLLDKRHYVKPHEKMDAQLLFASTVHMRFPACMAVLNCAFGGCYWLSVLLHAAGAHGGAGAVSVLVLALWVAMGLYAAAIGVVLWVSHGSARGGAAALRWIRWSGRRQWKAHAGLAGLCAAAVAVVGGTSGAAGAYDCALPSDDAIPGFACSTDSAVLVGLCVACVACSFTCYLKFAVSFFPAAADRLFSALRDLPDKSVLSPEALTAHQQHHAVFLARRMLKFGFVYTCMALPCCAFAVMRYWTASGAAIGSGGENSAADAVLAGAYPVVLLGVSLAGAANAVMYEINFKKQCSRANALPRQLLRAFAGEERVPDVEEGLSSERQSAAKEAEAGLLVGHQGGRRSSMGLEGLPLEQQSQEEDASLMLAGITLEVLQQMSSDTDSSGSSSDSSTDSDSDYYTTSESDSRESLLADTAVPAAAAPVNDGVDVVDRADAVVDGLSPPVSPGQEEKRRVLRVHVEQVEGEDAELIVSRSVSRRGSDRQLLDQEKGYNSALLTRADEHMGADRLLSLADDSAQQSPRARTDSHAAATRTTVAERLFVETNRHLEYNPAEGQEAKLDGRDGRVNSLLDAFRLPSRALKKKKKKKKGGDADGDDKKKKKKRKKKKKKFKPLSRRSSAVVFPSFSLPTPAADSDSEDSQSDEDVPVIQEES